MQKINFTKRIDNEAFEIPNKGIHYITCCDCGLVHKMAVAIEENGNIGVAFERDEYITTERRKDFDKKGKPKKDAPIVNRYRRETQGLSKRIEDLLDTGIFIDNEQSVIHEISRLIKYYGNRYSSEELAKCILDNLKQSKKTILIDDTLATMLLKHNNAGVKTIKKP